MSNFFKKEDLQNTRNFKIQGAANKILQLNHDNNNDQRLCIIVTASTGNHAQGVAYIFVNKLTFTRIHCCVKRKSFSRNIGICFGIIPNKIMVYLFILMMTKMLFWISPLSCMKYFFNKK